MKKFKITFDFILSHPLSSRHLLRAFLRIIKWQIQVQFSHKLIVKPFIGNVKFYAKRGLTGITGNIYSGLHEFFDMAFLIHYLREDDIFYDIGANVGSYTLLASGICKAKSFSIEPVNTTFDLLEKNITLNTLADRVKLFNAGAGSEPGFLTFSTNEDTTNHVVLDNDIEANTTSVPIIVIDSLLDGGSPTLIKIDVEGFETPVLNGMTTVLKSNELNAVIIELNGSGMRYGFDDSKIHQLLLNENFRPYHYDPFQRKLNPLASFGSHNTIYCRNLDLIKRRIESADKFKIMGEKI